MKKTIVILLSFAMIFALAACGNSTGQTEDSSAVETQPVETSDDAQEENSTIQDTGSVDTTEAQPAESETPEEQGTRILVAYFSATNTTEGVAEHIANGLNAKLYEIVPEDPYTDADLNYNDDNSRSTIEMNDPSSRPAIFGSVEDMEQYDIVFIGYLFFPISGKNGLSFLHIAAAPSCSSAPTIDRSASANKPFLGQSGSAGVFI